MTHIMRIDEMSGNIQSVNNIEWVDLNLPSGILWAKEPISVKMNRESILDLTKEWCGKYEFWYKFVPSYEDFRELNKYCNFNIDGNNVVISNRGNSISMPLSKSNLSDEYYCTVERVSGHGRECDYLAWFDSNKNKMESYGVRFSTDLKFYFHPIIFDADAANDKALQRLQRNMRSGCVTQQQMRYIKTHYTEYKDESKLFQPKFSVFIWGSDPKYGKIYIDAYRKEWRNTSFEEFYGSGIVD